MEYCPVNKVNSNPVLFGEKYAFSDLEQRFSHLRFEMTALFFAGRIYPDSALLTGNLPLSNKPPGTFLYTLLLSPLP